MCIAIVKTKHGRITDKQLSNCFDNNKHGAGLAYTINNELYVVKGIFNKKEFIDSVREAEQVADGAMLIHCRIATSGLVDADNCHPHVVHDNCVMIHNGILDIDVPRDSDKSDTVIFIDGILRQLPKNFMFKQYFIDLLAFAIGDYNKLCFLNSNGKFAIVNEDVGEWVDGVWYSNDSYKKQKPKKPAYTFTNLDDYYHRYTPSYSSHYGLY
jgi:predicted glutamine amidotransferase